MGSSATTWNGFAAALAGAGRRAIAIDARGHGASPRVAEYTFATMVGDLLAFLDQHALDRVDLIGHSMGGGVAQLFAGRYPGRVRRLVVEETAPPPRTAPADQPPDPPDEPPHPVDFDWRVVRPIMRAFRTPDPEWWALLGRISAPTLVVAGGGSSFVSQDRVRAAAAAIPDARIVEIDAGHHVHKHAAAAFAQAVLDFLA
jgi:esterase